MDADFTAQNAYEEKASAKAPWTPLLFFLAVLLAINLATLSRVPFVWLDEIYFADPAINMAHGEGFVSRAWDHSPETRPVSSTAPLFSLALAGWVKICGGELLAVRLFGLFLVSLGLIVLWSACQRWNVISSPRWLLTLSAVIALSYGFSFSYRSGRPESLLFLLWALLFHAASWRDLRARFSAVFLLALLIPFTGQVVCMALGIIMCALVVLSPRRWLSLALTIFVALMLGTLCFVITYKNMGIWADFQIAVNKQGGSPLLRLLHRLSSNPLSQHSNAIPKDFSVVPLVAALGWMGVLTWRQRLLRWNSLLTFALLYAFTLPLALYLLGKFPTYYAWMLTVPLAMVLCILCWQEEARSGRKLWIPRILLAVACLVGFPLQMAFALPDWKNRNYDTIRDWTHQVLRPDDVALVDYPFYYAARANARKVYLYGYGEQLRRQDVEALTVLILSPHKTYGMTREELMQVLGEDWMPTGESRRAGPSFAGNDWQLGYLSLPNYDGEVYRRKGSTKLSSTTSQ